MKVNLVKISLEEKPLLKGMLIDYFKEIDPSKLVLGNKGVELSYPYLDLYWKEPDRVPLKIVCNNELVGFVLMNNWIVCEDFQAEKSIAEFYIKQEYRRQGIGKAVAFQLFTKYKTKWEIRQASDNPQAIQFWRSIIKEFSQGKFKELENKDNMVIQLFES